MKLIATKSRKLRAVNSVHWLVAVFVVASAVAWAWHVDIPPPLEEQAVVSASAHFHNDDGGDLADRCDHCCHAGAHFMALLPAPVLQNFTAPDTHNFIIEIRLTPSQQDPPYIPPIA